MRTQYWIRWLMVGVTAAGSASANAVDLSPDHHSFANTNEFRVTHVALNLRADFQQQQLKGRVDLSFDRLIPGASEIVLDTRDLTISGVELRAADAGKALAFKVGDRHPIFGAPLTISLPKDYTAAKFVVRVRYTTSPQASGLQWLTPSQTAGKRQPFVYTQSQAIHARSWIPLQDTPAVRMTYDAHIETPRELLAVMSANNDPAAVRDGAYDFTMPQAIPSYLMALAVGDFSFKSISGRTGVYAEPTVLSTAAYEFADLELMVAACEKLFGPYRWGRYDLLILPPSYMWGGMENPRLTFITPTVIAGDRSLVSLIAHELAHSWSGNLVTNANWESAWLNEGVTTYLERRIVEALYGVDRRAMEDSLGMQSLRQDISELEGKGDGALTRLRVDLRNRDPDDGFSDVAYEKGRFFIGFLESRLGRARLDDFLRQYFSQFAFQSVTTEQFLDYLQKKVLSQPNAKITRAEVLAWMDQPGLPATVVEPHSDAFSAVDKERAEWLSGARSALKLATEKWTTQQWVHFLDNMPSEITSRQLTELDTAFRFTQVTNTEIAHSWLLVAIRAGYSPADARLETFLTTIGRRRFVKDLYEALLKTPQGKQRAQAIYAKARPLYQVPLAEQLDKVLGARG